jgi:hypothetical protein
MIYRTTFPSQLTGVLLGTALGALGCTAQVDPAADDISATRDPIINGTAVSSNEFNAAIYHYNAPATCTDPVTHVKNSWPNGWWPRPCSGTVIRKANNHTYVLTARHCVTVDGELNTAVQAYDKIRVTTAISPGIVQQNGVPPTSAKAVDNILAEPGGHGAYDSAYDGAILSVPGDLPLSPATNRFLVTFATTAELTKARAWISLAIYGYGRNVAGDCDWEFPPGGGTSGAGTLRYSSGFDSYNFYDAAFTRSHWNIYDSGTQAEWHGDSGGPTFYSNQYWPNWKFLVGVHSVSDGVSTDTDYGSARLAQFIQQSLGNLFLLPYANAYAPTTTTLVGVPSTLAGSKLSVAYTGDSAKTRVFWDAAAKHILFGGAPGTGKCVEDAGLGAPVVLHTCKSTNKAQQWTIAGNSSTTFTNVNSGGCLGLSGTSVISTPCATAALWAFRTSP